MGLLKAGLIVMPELRVPFVIDDEGRLYSPATAEKTGNYACPACREPVIFKHGKVKIPHFAHKATVTCNQETVTHKIAKMLIQNAVRDWKLGKGKQPIIQRACQVCGVSINQPLPEKVDGAVLEFRLTDGSIVDVALTVREIAQAAVEIKVTHAVDEIKILRLSLPFIELNGDEVIRNPLVWKPIADKFKPLTCDNCKAAYVKFQAKAEQVAKVCGIELPTAYYRHGLCTCWKCKREIIVFAWPKNGIHDDSPPKIKPVPKTVQYRYSNTLNGKYWVNTCPYCQSIQGDFFLHRESDGPFFAVNIEEDYPTEFRKDMLKIAAHALL
ncbi:MAG: competence protein CoiA family protein [Candidatus Methylumidiphilus sp.]